MTTLSLEDKFSVTPTGVMVGLANTVLTYGPQFVEVLNDSRDEEMMKGLLKSAGRSGLMNSGSELESERFRMFKGMFAYEGIAKTHIENTKITVTCAASADYLLFVLRLVDARSFEEKAAELEKLIDRYLEIEPPANKIRE